MSAPHQEYWTMRTYSAQEKKANSLKGVRFIYVAESDAMIAMKMLSGNGFKLWYYLAGNKDGDSFFPQYKGEIIRFYC